MNDSHLDHYEECPHCHIDGRKKTYAVYTDGHCYCFWCKRGTRVKYRGQQTQVDNYQSEKIVLPAGLTTQFPDRAINWIRQYGLGYSDLEQHKVMWNDQRQRLVFPYYINDELVGWQGRYFGVDPKEPKWFSRGKLHELIYILHPELLDHDRSSSLVLVEDIVSAIRISVSTSSMPLFGTDISGARLKQIKALGYNIVTFWLDNDAAPKAAKAYGLALAMGLNARMIITDKDPKEYSDLKIKEFLK